MIRLANKGASSDPPTIRMAPAGVHGDGGFLCCFFRCCTCIHLEFLKSTPGIIKIAEALVSGYIQSLLINYGLRYSSTIGCAFEGSFTTSSASFFTSAMLLGIYVISKKSYRLIRASLFEMIFNALTCFFYASSASYMAFVTKIFLWPIGEIYSAMSAVSLLSGVAAILHGADAYCCFRDFNELR